MKTVSQTVIKADKFYTVTGTCGKVMEAAEAAENGAAVQLGVYNHDPKQEWAFIRVGDGVYHLQNRGTGKVLDLMMGGSADGTWLHQWENVGSSSQMWIIDPTNDGHVKLRSQLARTRCVDVVGMSTEAGTRLQIWQDVNGENQLWTLAAVVEKRTRKVAKKTEPAAEAPAVEEKPAAKKAPAKKVDEATAAPAKKRTAKAAAKKADAAEAATPVEKKPRTRKAAKKADAE